MLNSHPVIFISAVSRELRSTRDLVAKTLAALGYEPKWQDIAPTETGDLCAVLRKWVDESHAVLQIVGHRYGFAPETPDKTFGEVSYTQYEILYARSIGKKIWYIILDENHPVDCPDDEPEHLRKLQSDYRIQVKAHHGLFHPSSTPLVTENIVLKLRDDLAKLRRRSRLWTTAILVMSLLLVSGVAWLIHSQTHVKGSMETVADGSKDLAAQIALLKAELDQSARTRNTSSPQPSQDQLEEELATNLGWTREKLSKILADGRASDNLLIQGQSNLVSGNVKTAEENFDKVIDSSSEASRLLIAAFEGKATIATFRGQYADALKHRETAAALIDKKNEPLKWAAAQNEIVYLLLHLDDTDRAQPLAQQILDFSDSHPPPDNSEVLVALNNLAQVLQNKGNFAEALPLMERALEISENTFGKNDPHIATILNNIAQLYVETGTPQKATPFMERTIQILLKSTKNKAHDHSRLPEAISNYAMLMGKIGIDRNQIFTNLLAIGVDAGWEEKLLREKLNAHPSLAAPSEKKQSPDRVMVAVTCPYCHNVATIAKNPNYRMWFRCVVCSNSFSY